MNEQQAYTAKVILICGKICCGKSTYAAQLQKQNKAIILSVDEIMLAVFGQYAGEKHDEYVRNIKGYILDKSLDIVKAGLDVILDCGFWTKEERAFTKDFYRKRNIPCQLHYIDIRDEIWQQRIDKRNSEVSAGKANAYYVDENLLKKIEGGFEALTRDEADVWVNAEA